MYFQWFIANIATDPVAQLVELSTAMLWLRVRDQPTTHYFDIFAFLCLAFVLGSQIGRFPWKFPEVWISQDMQISNEISRNLRQGQRTAHRKARQALATRI